jgi:hypothetical protein
MSEKAVATGTLHHVGGLAWYWIAPKEEQSSMNTPAAVEVIQ